MIKIKMDGRIIDLQEQDEILTKVGELLPGSEHVQSRVDLLIFF